VNTEVQRYAESVADERRQLFDKLQALILGMYPDAEVRISYQVPMYKVQSGRVALGYWKNGVSVYAVPAPQLADFKAKYPAIKTGKGSINFRVTDAIPMAALKRIIEQAMERSK